MAIRTKIRKSSKHSTKIDSIHLWDKLRGLLSRKGPKDIIGWQKRGRKDRKIL